MKTLLHYMLMPTIVYITFSLLLSRNAYIDGVGYTHYIIR